MPIALSDKLIADIASIAERCSVSKIILFGSRARGDQRATSDIDLAVYPLPDSEDVVGIFDEIDELETLLKIDLVIVSEHTDRDFLKRILDEGVVIYERSAHQTE